MDDREDYPMKERALDYGTATAADREVSPTERLMNENEKLLAVLNETVSELRHRVKHVSSSNPRDERKTDEGSAPRLGSSALLDNLYNQQAQINRANRGLREILDTLEV